MQKVHVTRLGNEVLNMTGPFYVDFRRWVVRAVNPRLRILELLQFSMLPMTIFSGSLFE